MNQQTVIIIAMVLTVVLISVYSMWEGYAGVQGYRVRRRQMVRPIKLSSRPKSQYPRTTTPWTLTPGSRCQHLQKQLDNTQKMRDEPEEERLARLDKKIATITKSLESCNEDDQMYTPPGFLTKPDVNIPDSVRSLSPEDAAEELKTLNPEFTIRRILQGQPISMDYRPNRLTIIYNTSDEIVDITQG